MTKLQFLQAVKARLEAWRDQRTGDSVICDAAYKVASQGDGSNEHYGPWLTGHIEHQLDPFGAAFVSVAAFQVMFGDSDKDVDDVLKFEAGLMKRGPLATAIRILWVDQFIHATERALPLPPFPSKADLGPLFKPYMKEQ